MHSLLPGGCLAHDGQVVGTTVETYRRGRHQHQLSVFLMGVTMRRHIKQNQRNMWRSMVETTGFFWVAHFGTFLHPRVVKLQRFDLRAQSCASIVGTAVWIAKSSISLQDRNWINVKSRGKITQVLFLSYQLVNLYTSSSSNNFIKFLHELNSKRTPLAPEIPSLGSQLPKSNCAGLQHLRPFQPRDGTRISLNVDWNRNAKSSLRVAVVTELLLSLPHWEKLYPLVMTNIAIENGYL